MKPPFLYLACAEVSFPWTVSTDPHQLCNCCYLTCADVLLYLLLDVAVPLSVPCNELFLGLRHNYKLLVFRTFPAFLSNVVNNLCPCMRYLVMRNSCYAVLPLQFTALETEKKNYLALCLFMCRSCTGILFEVGFPLKLFKIHGIFPYSSLQSMHTSIYLHVPTFLDRASLFYTLRLPGCLLQWPY